LFSDRKNGIVQKREYYVIFNAILGELFIHCTIEGNTLEHLKMNELILSYEKKEALEGLKYVITLPEKGTLSRNGMEGPKRKNRFEFTKSFWISKMQYVVVDEGWVDVPCIIQLFSQKIAFRVDDYE
jgi:hypothetical protein